jgi:hypothetical protein
MLQQQLAQMSYKSALKYSAASSTQQISTAAILPNGLKSVIESSNDSLPKNALDKMPEMQYEHAEPLDNSLEMESQTKKEFKSFSSQ